MTDTEIIKTIAEEVKGIWCKPYCCRAYHWFSSDKTHSKCGMYSAGLAIGVPSYDEIGLRRACTRCLAMVEAVRGGK